MKRFLSMLLAAALAAAVLVWPASAADPAPWVQVDGLGTAAQPISLRGLTGSYDSIQITLTLDKAPTGFVFDPTLSNADTHTASSISATNKASLFIIFHPLSLHKLRTPGTHCRPPQR